MRTTFLIAFVLYTLIISAFSAIERQPLVRELKLMDRDSVFVYHYFYDNYNNKVLEVKYFMQSEVLMPLNKTEWIYEGKNRVSQRIDRWSNGIWVSESLITAEFLGNRKTRETFITFVGGNQRVDRTHLYHYQSQHLVSVHTYAGALPNAPLVQEQHFTYLSNDSLLTQEQINHVGSEVHLHRWHFSYNSVGQRDSVIMSFYQQGTHVSSDLSRFYYDAEGRVTRQVQMRLNNHSNTWENKAATELEYNVAGQKLSEELFHHTGMFWTPHTRYEYHYNTDGILQAKMMLQPIHRRWRNMFTVQYSQFEFGRPKLMESTFNFWGGNTGEPVSALIPVYFNEELILMKAETIQLRYLFEYTHLLSPSENILRAYPNPSSGIFYVSTQYHQIVSWEVFDLKGVLLKRNVNAHQTGVIDLTGFPPGTFVLRVTTSNQQRLTQKVVLLQP